MINNDYYGLLNIHVTCANFKVQNVPFIILKIKKLQSATLKDWSPWYSWNIAESGIKTQKINK
jgi:hypothetical protein